MMDEIFGLLADQVAKKVREAQAQARAQAQAQAQQIPQARPQPAPQAGIQRVRGAARPQKATAPARRGMPEAPDSIMAPAKPRPERPPPPPDPFAIAPASQTPPANPLLAAFAGRNALLAGIVLGEALAPPLALRERKPGHA